MSVTLPFPDGSPQQESLRALLRGHPAVLVDSPPGAGKSTMVAEAGAFLHENTTAKVAVATFTWEVRARMAAAEEATVGS